MLRALALALLLFPAPSQAAEPESQPKLQFLEGPVMAKMGDMAEMDLPKGYSFVDKDNAGHFMEATGNFASGSELGILLKDGKAGYFAIYEFEDIGYIKDAAGEKMDADGLIQSMKEGTEEANKERKERGWDEIHVVGWEFPPAYNAETQRLEWAVRASSGKEEIVNYFTRVLGRKGAMKVTVVCDSAVLPAVRQDFHQRMQAFNYTEGNKYAEYKEGDKVAKYGLAALILGGAAAKTGLLGKLGKLLAAAGKFLIVILLALGAAIKKGVDYLKGRKAQPVPVAAEPSSQDGPPKA